MIPKSAQDTIRKWTLDSMARGIPEYVAKQRAIESWESIMRAPLPQIVRNTIRIKGV